jgi:hypothetical protein
LEMGISRLGNRVFEVFRNIKEGFGTDYFIWVDNYIKGPRVHFRIKPENESLFISAYNLIYPEYPLVNENVQFERGADPKRSMGIGLIDRMKSEMIADDYEWAGIDGVGINGALIWSADKGRVDYVQYLLDEGADPNITWGGGLTPLIVASIRGVKEIVELLLDAGADPDIQSRDGWTALMWAATKNNLEIMKTLLDAGADPDIENNINFTALMLTSKHGQYEAAEILLEAGADVDITGRKKWTALELATKGGYIEIEDLLKKYGATE